VFASWINSFADYRDLRIAKAVYCQEHHNGIVGVFSDPNSRVLMAVEPSDDNQIFGWLASSNLPVGSFLHYVFVKPLYRRLGVAAGLLQANGLFDAYTHHTPCAPWVVGKAVFDPYRFICQEPSP
jgi:hypothetical protein